VRVVVVARLAVDRSDRRLLPGARRVWQVLAKLDALTATSSVDDYKNAVADAKSALAALKAVAGPFAGAQLDAPDRADPARG
jgi:hypothetical protein